MTRDSEFVPRHDAHDALRLSCLDLTRDDPELVEGSKGGIRDSARAHATSQRAWCVVAAVAVAMIMAGCGGSNTPTTPSNTSQTVTENWSSVVVPGGASTRSFSVNSAGTIAVTLTGGATTMGLGVGLPRTTGGGCRLGVAVNASAGTTPQITTQADAGQYCVQVYDLGTLTDPIGVSVKIEHP